MNGRVLSALAAGSLVSAGLVGLGVVIAGPLNPPAGPVSPTYKTLVEVEPRTAVNAVNTPGDADSLYRIDQPGSYYLTGNITGVSGKSGIEIAANDVTLDLRGFSLTGVPGALSGVTSNSAHTVVSNGSLTLWPQVGVAVSGNAAQLRDLDLRGCGGHGAELGAWAQVERCQSITNGGAGVHFLSNGDAIDCVAVGNSGTGLDGETSYRQVYTRCLSENNAVGMRAGYLSRLSDCTANFNTGNGFTVVTSTLERCTAGLNATGFGCGAGSALSGCSAFSNFGGANYVLGDTCTASGCAASGGGAPFTTGVGCTLTGCSAQAPAGLTCYLLGTGSAATECTSQGGDTGFAAGLGCTLTRCNARGAASWGFNLGSQAVVTGCESTGNGSAGFIIGGAGTGVRLEGNHAAGNPTGFQVQGGGNLVVRNSSTGNTTPYSIAAGNGAGPVVAAASVATNASPHANFTH